MKFAPRNAIRQEYSNWLIVVQPGKESKMANSSGASLRMRLTW
jgi:hypothetical protein